VRWLILIPIVHTEVDLGSHLARVKSAQFGRESWHEHLRAIEELWTKLRERVLALPMDHGVVRLYQDGLPASGSEMEIVEELARRGSRNHRLLLDLVGKGAVLMGTEDPSLLLEEWERLQGESLGRPGPGSGEGGSYDELLARRDEYIAGIIAHTLRPGEVGRLFIGMLHRLVETLPADIEVQHLVLEG